MNRPANITASAPADDALHVRLIASLSYEDALAMWKRSVARREAMRLRFRRRGASYDASILAANTLFPLAPFPKASGATKPDGFVLRDRKRFPFSAHKETAHV